jgi:hypothetical protein
VKQNNDAGFGILPGTIEGQAEGVIPSFSRGRDDDLANDLLKVLATDDWTSVWLPSTAPWSKLALDYSGNDRIDGWYFGAGITGQLATNTPMPAGVWAAIPGMAQLGGVFYGQSADGEPHSISDILPSVNMLAGMAWMRLQVETGQCANVDFEVVRKAWSLWQSQGVAWLETSSMKGSGDIAMARVMARRALGLDQSDLYPGNNKPIATKVSNELDRMREQLHRLLGTLACAYVPPSAPALRNPMLKLRYAAMRVALLKHKARFRVELALVPDAVYRELLFQSRLGLKAPGLDGFAGGSGQTLDDSPAPKPPVLPGVSWKAPDAEDGEGGSGWLWGVGLGLAAMLAAWKLRGR